MASPENPTGEQVIEKRIEDVRVCFLGVGGVALFLLMLKSIEYFFNPSRIKIETLLFFLLIVVLPMGLGIALKIKSKIIWVVSFLVMLFFTAFFPLFFLYIDSSAYLLFTIPLLLVLFCLVRLFQARPYYFKRER